MNNSSANRFNPTQGSMKKTGQSIKNNNDGEYMGSNFGNMGQSSKEFGMNSSNSASLKGKLQTLEVLFTIKLYFLKFD